MTIYNNVVELIGNTPIVRVNNLTQEMNAEVYLKLEFMNPGFSVKDRTALGMLNEAEQRGVLKPGDTIVEPTSGNTGIGLSLIAVVRGYRMILVMPDSMSYERQALLGQLGAEVVLTPGEYGMQGSIDHANALVDEFGYYMVSQFNNPANPQIHVDTTAQEILHDFKETPLDYFVAGIGTGGTFSGVSRVLKPAWPNLTCVAVEPAGSPVLSGGKRGMHGIQGIGAGFVPDNFHRQYADQIMQCDEDDAYRCARACASQEGMLVGTSAGAALWAALEIAKQQTQRKRILAIVPDAAERYVRTPLFLTKKRVP